MAPAIRDEVGDRDQLQPVLRRHLPQLRQAGHRAVRIHDLADDPRRTHAGEAREVDRCFRVARALQHPTGLRAQGERVTRFPEVLRDRVGVEHLADGCRSVVGRDPRASVREIDRNAERGLVRRGQLGNHRRDRQLVEALGDYRHADQAAPVCRHEVDDLRRDALRGDDEVAFVLAVCVVDDDDDVPLADVGDCLFDRSEHVGSNGAASPAWRPVASRFASRPEPAVSPASSSPCSSAPAASATG